MTEPLDMLGKKMMAMTMMLMMMMVVFILRGLRPTLTTEHPMCCNHCAPILQRGRKGSGHVWLSIGSKITLDAEEA